MFYKSTSGGRTIYDFSELLRLSNHNQNAYEFLTIDHHPIILLNGHFAIEKFNDVFQGIAVQENTRMSPAKYRKQH